MRFFFPVDDSYSASCIFFMFCLFVCQNKKVESSLVACLVTFDKYCLTYKQKCRYNIYVGSGMLLFPEEMYIAVQCMPSALLDS